MKLSTTLSIFLILLLFVSTSSAQDRNLDEEDLKEWTRGAQIVPTKSSAEVEGSPYYNEEWQRGYVILKSGKKSDPVSLKYSSYTNELLYEKEDKLLAVVPKIMEGFVLVNNNRQTVFRKGFQSEEHDISPAQLLRIIHVGNIKLLAKHEVRQNKRRDVLGGGNEIIKYIPKMDYFLITVDGKFHEIKLKEKNILRALGFHKNRVKRYAKSNDLSFKNEDDLRSILLAYDNMIEADKTNQ